MSEITITPVTAHVNTCVKILNEWLQNNPVMEVQGQERTDAFEAVFELIDQPWSDLDEQDRDWREGYEMCLLDVVDAIAGEWGISLPVFQRSENQS